MKRSGRQPHIAERDEPDGDPGDPLQPGLAAGLNEGDDADNPQRDPGDEEAEVGVVGVGIQNASQEMSHDRTVATLTEFRSLRPVKMDVVYNVVRDLMLTDFGMESVWAMDARHAFLDIKGVETISANRIELHPAGLDALQRWLFDQRFTDRPEDRRLARLRDKANEAREDHAAHPWFHGRRINGASDESIPAWFDSGLLWAFPNVDAQQVILRPVVTKAAHGMNVTYFEMEKVNV